ncbi:MAG: beta-ketoacyl-ACP synthase II [Anaerolineae bacterium]|nr:beta-ketoacyl-ACP synthase II [Anaerolineae bacterium]NIN99159.1 beta-ketoacyl-ACP synthase II [Anaerolineae bacterium]NIQ82000.1 beta-ketoacyl-ACP synthase II [Anaerolineae bacterium]
MARDQSVRVVVTGMGALTPLGLNVKDTWQALVEGRSGIGRITQFDASAYPVQIAGEVRGFEPEEYMSPKEAKKMARFSQLAVGAATMALADAQFSVDESNAEEVGVVMGTAIGGGLIDTERVHLVLLNKGVRRVPPVFVPSILPNAAAHHVASAFGIMGYTSTPVTACAAGTQAIGEGARAIRDGCAQVVLAGGTESTVCGLALAGMSAMRALSTRNDEPERASRPFDAERDGFVASEGCGMLILERLDQALARGARIYAEVLGYGVSSDPYHVSAPDPEGTGSALAMRRAIADAGLTPEEIQYINAHATATPIGDPAEVVAIKKVFGPRAYEIPVNATKSMIGHLLGAAGTVEAIATIMTMQDGILHPTINYETPDPACDLDCVPNKARKAHVDIAISNSFGFGGQNGCLVFGSWEA